MLSLVCVCCLFVSLFVCYQDYIREPFRAIFMDSQTFAEHELFLIFSFIRQQIIKIIYSIILSLLVVS